MWLGWWETRNAYSIFVGKPLIKGPLERVRRRQEDDGEIIS
jgi:hypothetical protein